MTLTTVSTAVLHCDKTFKVCFVLIFAVFLPDFIFCTTVAQSHPSFIKIVDVFDLYTPYNPNVHCAVSSNDHYQGNGFAVEVLVGYDRPNGSTVSVL